MNIENLSEPVDPANTCLSQKAFNFNSKSGAFTPPTLLHIVF